MRSLRVAKYLVSRVPGGLELSVLGHPWVVVWAAGRDTLTSWLGPRKPLPAPGLFGSLPSLYSSLLSPNLSRERFCVSA